MKLAGSNPDERESRVVPRRFDESQRIAFALNLPKTCLRREQILLPGVWTDDVTEQRFVAATFQPIDARFLFVRPSDGKIVDGRDVVIDDRPLPHRRSDEPMARGQQNIENFREVPAL